MPVRDDLQLLRRLRFFFSALGRDVLNRFSLETERPPDLTHWIAPMVRALQPLLLGFFQGGMLRTAARLQRRQSDGIRRYRPEVFGRVKRYVGYGGVSTHENVNGIAPAFMAGSCVNGDAGDLHTGLSPTTLPKHTHSRPPFFKSLSPASARLVTKAAGTLGTSFDLYNPRVIDAVDQLTLDFCRETLDTATKDLAEALADLRSLLKEGLSHGQVLGYVSRKVGEVFNDPARSARIAVTELSRASHAGQVLSAKELGATTKRWLANDSSCDKCKQIDGKEVEIDQPFLVEGTGPYAMVMHPPLHPFCWCSEVEE